MCIRDRIDSVRVDADNACTLFAQDDIVCEAFDGAEDKAMLVNTLLAERPARRIVAVSYTHLDVYKRQVLYLHDSFPRG